MKDIIINFIKKQTCASVCCSTKVDNHPYCFSCFYAFNSDEGLLYFKSSEEATHSKIISENQSVAGTILPDKLNAFQIKGIQFEGIILPDDDVYARGASAQYHQLHPMALAMPGHIWTIQLTEIKLTDNTLGFGKKITWSRSELRAL
jgi:uncharacterized protein YhbP (UPF0306 family)